MFQCSNGQCVDFPMRCDRKSDCSDGSDELYCPTAPPPPARTERPTLPPDSTRRPSVTCPFGYVNCLSEDQCILQNQLCDGRVDCNDMSDESRCGRYF